MYVYCAVVGMTVEKFVSSMSEKLVSQDEDEDIRHTFMAFDVQCKLNKN